MKLKKIKKWLKNHPGQPKSTNHIHDLGYEIKITFDNTNQNKL